MWVKVTMLLLLTTTVVAAQHTNALCNHEPIPVEKKVNPFKSKQFWLTLGIRVGMEVWDAESTVSAHRRNDYTTEGNPIFSSRPSRAELYWKGGLIELGATLITAAVWRKDERTGRGLDIAITIPRVVLHSAAIEGNNSIPWRKCPAGTRLVNRACVTI